jgi:glycosyltransferase involved in cell wall biosynthesis
MARQVDAIHAAVPGDIGTAGLLLGLLKRKRLYVRHCGTWGDRSTLANRFLAWLLPKIAGGRVVVMATGGAPDPPEAGNPAIEWIFASSLSQADLDRIEPVKGWAKGEQLRLVTVGRLTKEKNALASIRALKEIRKSLPGCSLTVVGEGPIRPLLEQTAVDLDLVDAVTFTGNVNHEGVIETLLVSHIFLFPTRVAEGYPKAVMEAMACGLPVVASRVSVLPHLLGNGCGVLLDGTSARDVAKKVVRLVQSPRKMAEIGWSARGAVRELTLERWRGAIGERLEEAWGQKLKSLPNGSASGTRWSS